MNYYTIESNAWDLVTEIRLGQIPDTINKRAYLMDEWSCIDDKREFIPYEKLGKEMPDIYTYNIPLISSKLKELLDDAGVTDVFYKPIDLFHEDEDEEEFFLLLAKPVDCVVWEKSEYTLSKASGMKKITGAFEIDVDKIGDLKLFKVDSILNKFWIIDDDIKNRIEEAQLKGIKLLKLEDYYGL